MLESAYVAGIIDGEGCINFSRARTTIFVRILVVNTNCELLEMLKDQYGGDIYPLSGRHTGWNQAYQWRLSGTKAIDLLDEIYPFLIVKRLQADTAFAWQACRGGRGRAFDPETAGLLLRRMRWLNTRGPKQGDDPAIAAAQFSDLDLLGLEIVDR